MLGILLAAALVGPPAPKPQDQTKPAYEQRREDAQAARDKAVLEGIAQEAGVAEGLEQVRKVADGTFLDATFIAAGSAFDVWATDHCISKGKCYELNPLGQIPTQRLALKAGLYPVKVGACYLLRRWGHHNWARGAALGVTAIDVFLGAKALKTVH